MRLGLGLGLSSAAVAGSTFDPATLSLTGWWREYAGASPWVGTASAGTSGSHNLTEATNPPSTGTALNGHGVATFARASSNKLANASAISTFITASAWSAWALVKMVSEDTDAVAGGAYGNDAILSDNAGSFWACAVRSTGPKCQAYQFGASANAAEATFANAAWQLLQFRYDGTNLSARVNAGTWVTQAIGNIANVTHTLFVGVNYAGTAFINGDVAELAVANTALADADFENVRGYVDARYGLAL